MTGRRVLLIVKSVIHAIFLHYLSFRDLPICCASESTVDRINTSLCHIRARSELHQFLRQQYSAWADWSIRLPHTRLIFNFNGGDRQRIFMPRVPYCVLRAHRNLLIMWEIIFIGHSLRSDVYVRDRTIGFMIFLGVAHRVLWISVFWAWLRAFRADSILTDSRHIFER